MPKFTESQSEAGAKTGDRAIENSRDRAALQIARVFRRFGYEAASMSILSAETKLGRSSLYHYFPGGKEEMAAAVLDLAERFLRDDLMAILREPGDPRRQVEKFIRRLNEYYEGGTVGCLFATLALHDCPPAIGARVATLTRDWITSFATYLRTRGEPEPRARAEKIVRLIQGGLVVALATQDPKPFTHALHDLRPLLGR